MGDTVKFEKLADTLEIIAKEGASAFYTGPLAKDLVQDVRDAGATVVLSHGLDAFPKLTLRPLCSVCLGTSSPGSVSGSENENCSVYFL